MISVGEPHLHATVVANVPHRGWPAVKEPQESKHRISTHCVPGSGQGVEQLRKALEYPLVPSEQKRVLRKEPFPSSNSPPQCAAV